MNATKFKVGQIWSRLVPPLYLEILPADETIFGSNVFVRFEHNLNKRDLRAIGKFTRENIMLWINTTFSPDPLFPEGYFHIGDPMKDFRAVCGDMEIPWADSASFQAKPLAIKKEVN